jgi:hypothetical protein
MADAGRSVTSASETGDGLAEPPWFPANKPPALKRRLAILAIGVAAYFVAGLLTLVPHLVETVYAATTGPAVVWLLSRITGLIPFSLTELCYAAYGGWVIGAVVMALRQVWSGSRSTRNLLACGATRLARDIGVIVLLFYVAWGYNYSRPSLEDRLTWTAWAPGDLEELRGLAEQLVEAGNEAYRSIHNTTDAGVPTTLPHGLRDVHRSLEDAWDIATGVLGLPVSNTRTYGSPKYLLSSPVYARLGITGFYFPYTAEANVRRGLPALSLPQSVAHEKAHQRGIGPEAEASFLGFVAGALSTDPYVRYSSIMFAERQLMAALARADRRAWRTLAEQRLPGVRRDLEDLSEYFRQFVGVGTSVGRSVNDQFLRANRVEGGVLNYGRAARLLITFSRRNDGVVIPSTP